MACAFAFSDGSLLSMPLFTLHPSKSWFVSYFFLGAPHVLDGIWKLVDNEWKFFWKTFTNLTYKYVLLDRDK